MNLLGRLRRNRLALLGVAGLALVLVFSVAAVVLIPTGPAATPTPPPGGSPTPVPSPTPAAANCTSGQGSAPASPGPSSAPSAEPTNAAGPKVDSLNLGNLPAVINRTVAAGSFKAVLQGKETDSFSLTVTKPDGEVVTAVPGVGKVEVSFELSTGGAVKIEASSTSTNTAKITITYQGAVAATPAPDASPTARPTLPPRTAGTGDRCAYVSVYVHLGDEGTPIDPNAKVVAKRITLFSDPGAPSIDVVGVLLPDNGFSLAVGSGATWRILVDDGTAARELKRVFDREASRPPAQVCPEVGINIVPGQAKRFVLEVFRTTEVVSCPGPVALIEDGLAIVPDKPPAPPPILLNPVRLGVETGQALRYRPDVIAYLRSLEETNTGLSPLAAAYFVIGVGGMVLFGSFAIWLLFGAQDLGATRDQPISTRRRRRWRR